MIRRLRRDRRGSVTILAAGGMIALLGMTALAVDVGGAYLKARELQGAADAAALAAVGSPNTPQTAATAALGDNGWAGATVQVEQGRYVRDPAVPVASRFTAGGAQPDAARVTVTADAPLHLAGALFGRRSVSITRRATAMRISQASFSIGTRLASVQNGLANALLGQLVGGSLNLSVASYDALLGANVDLFATLDALRTRLNLAGATYDQLLAANVTVPVLLRAIGDALTENGEDVAATALNQVADSAAARSLQASRLIDLGPLGARTDRGGVRIGLSAWDFAQSAIMLAGGPRQVSVDLAAALGASLATVYFATGERPVHSPWLTMTGSSTAVVRTAQSRLYVHFKLPVLGLAALTVPIYAELGSAEARLSSISCPTGATAEARLAVTPSAGHIALRQVANPSGALGDFTHDVTETPVDLVNVLGLIRISSNAHIALGGTAAQPLTFTRADVDAGTVRSVATNDLGAGIAQSLLRPDNLTMPFGTTLLLNRVLGVLNPVVGLLDPLLNSIMGLVGIRVGEADVRMNGLRCGQPILVA